MRVVLQSTIVLQSGMCMCVFVCVTLCTGVYVSECVISISATMSILAFYLYKNGAPCVSEPKVNEIFSYVLYSLQADKIKASRSKIDYLVFCVLKMGWHK